MEVTRGMQLAFAQMQSDAEHMAGATLVANRQTLDSSDGRLTLVRTVFLENTASRVQVISYRLVGGVLLRRESAATRDLAQLDILWKAAISDTDTTPPVALQAGIAAMQMLVWQNGAWAQSVSGNTVTPQGLQVAMQVQNAEAPMSKSFLLGGL
jgi:general secretion pathway protein J